MWEDIYPFNGNVNFFAITLTPSSPAIMLTTEIEIREAESIIVKSDIY